MKLILKNYQSPGDILMLTSLVRDIKKAYPHFKIRAKTSADEFFLNNPNVESTVPTPKVFNTNAKNGADRFNTDDEGWQEIQVYYGDDEQFGKKIDNPWSIHKCNTHKKHFMYGMTGYINKLLGLNITPTELKPDIYLTEEEKKPLSGLPKNYWVIVPGGKQDYPRKIYPKKQWKEIITLLPDVNFVQIGALASNHISVDLSEFANVVNLTGKTTLRQALTVIYNARGVICPITFAMLAASCWPEKKCVVLAGGGEDYTWQAISGHDYLHTIGALSCCRYGGCWSGECKNKNPETGNQRCMELIQPKIVADIVRTYGR